MAKVFLSYDREDSGKAGSVAEALEEAGHSVWWDRHIRGGSQFSKEIEEALEKAEAVVVLWSSNSIESAWVRDEAAAGRDSGRLVPVTIDGAQPPLGFRQFQTIDLARWKGRKATADFKQLLSAISKSDKANIEERQLQKISPGPAFRVSPRLIIAIIIASIAAAGALYWSPWSAKREAPLVAVAAATSSPADSKASADLLVKLGVLQASHADNLQLVEPGSKRSPDFIIKVADADAGKVAQAQMRLLDNRDDTLLWSDEFGVPGVPKADLRQQMAYSAGKVLNCAVEAFSAPGQRLELPTLKLYLNGCANLSNLLAQDPRAAFAIFAKVSEQAPEFEGAWKKLLLAEIQVLRFSFATDPRVRQNLQQRLVQARRYHPAIAEGFLADAMLRQGKVSTWIKFVEQATARDPDNPDLLSYVSLVHTNVGLMQTALTDARRAVQADPLSPAAREALITAMLNVGDAGGAREELERAEQLWPGATSVLGARFAVEFRVGDAARALAMLRSGKLGPRYTPASPRAVAAHESYLKARIQPTEESKRQAIADARALFAQDPVNSWVVSRALSEFGSVEELISFLMGNSGPVPTNTTWTIFRASFASLHKDPRFMRIAAKLGLVEYWRESGNWADFCSAADLPYDCKVEAARFK